jgi:hypothetical protein
MGPIFVKVYIFHLSKFFLYNNCFKIEVFFFNINSIFFLGMVPGFGIWKNSKLGIF